MSDQQRRDPRPSAGQACMQAPAFSRTAVDQLSQQSWDLHTTDPDHAIALATAALTTATALDYTHGIAHSHYILGACHVQLNAYAAARSELLAALDYYEALNEREAQANALNMLGNVHSALGDHHAAYELYLRSLTIRQALGLAKAEAASWNNIGNACYHLRDYQHALEAHQRSLALKETLGDQVGCATSLNNIGNVYQAGENLESALHYYHQSLSLAQTVGDKYRQAGALGNLGSVYSALNDPRAALTYHLQSLAIEREIGNRHGEAESLMELGKLFLAYPDLAPLTTTSSPDRDPALSHLQQAQTIAGELQASEILMHIAELMAQLYEQRGDFAQALTAFRQFHALERAIFDETLVEKTKKLQIIHQVETAVQEAELKRIEAELAHLKNTELQALLQEADRQRAIAEEASRFKTKLLSIAAHDLRNPLSGIIGYADLLLMQFPDSADSRDLVARMRQSAQRMQHILDNLLDSTRIESGKLQIQIETVNLGLLAHQVVEAYQQPALQKSQTLIISTAGANLVRADRSCMWRVLENLISNAIKFSPYERRIWVALTRVEQHVRCVIRDEGPGLTVDDHARLFGRFERLSATPTGGEHSTGLGLAIVRQLVDLQGGRVWAESAGPGQGSSFIVELPSSALP